MMFFGIIDLFKWTMEGSFRALEQIVQLDNFFLGVGFGCMIAVLIIAILSRREDETRFVVYDPTKGAIYLQDASVLASPDQEKIAAIVAKQVADQVSKQVAALLPAPVSEPVVQPSPDAVNHVETSQVVPAGPSSRSRWKKRLLNIVLGKPRAGVRRARDGVPSPMKNAGAERSKKPRAAKKRGSEKKRRVIRKPSVSPGKIKNIILGKPKRKKKESVIDLDGDALDLDVD